MCENFILEIATESLPALDVQGVLRQTSSIAESFLKEKKLKFQSMATLGNCHRLTLQIHALHPQTDHQLIHIAGPSLERAKENERWTQAATKFAVKHQQKVEQIHIRDTKKGKYTYLIKQIGGIDAIIVLPKMIETILSQLSFSKKMRWKNDFYFGRPIRNILALYGNAVVPYTVEGIESKAETLDFSPSSFLSPIVISNANDYVSLLAKHRIYPSVQERKKIIHTSIEKILSPLNYNIDTDEKLMQEIRYSTENPSVILGEINSIFLEQLPQDLFIMCLKKYQKFFPVKNKDDQLVPYFVAIYSQDKKQLQVHKNEIRKNYIHTLETRLRDNILGFEEDKEKKFSDFYQGYGKVLVGEKCGSMLEQNQRLKEIVLEILSDCDVVSNAELLENTIRAVQLSKFDLLTNIVYEYPELQGIMGWIYTSLWQEKDAISTAIKEQYLPITKDDPLPSSDEGCLLSITNRIDRIVVACLSKEKMSGSSDPHGLKRTISGLFALLYSYPLFHVDSLSLRRLFENNLNRICTEKKQKDETLDTILNLLESRLTIFLSEQGYTFQSIYSIYHKRYKEVYSWDMYTIFSRIRLVKTISKHTHFEEILQLARRCISMLEKVHETDQYALHEVKIDPSQFKSKTEAELYQNLIHMLKKNNTMEYLHQSQPIIDELLRLKELLFEFFNHTNIIDQSQPIITKNRLCLLSILEKYLLSIADFTCFWKNK